MSIPWDLIIEAVLEIIKECTANRAEIQKSIKNPTPFVRSLVQWRVGRIVRQEQGRRFWRHNRDEIMEQTWQMAQQMTDQEVEYLLDQAT